MKVTTVTLKTLVNSYK